MTDARARMAAALRDLAEVARTAADDLHRLGTRAEDLRILVEGPEPMSTIVEGEERPLIVTTVTDVTDRLIEAGSECRRAEAQLLRAEGNTQERIAGLLGVTRQRAAALLASEPTGRSRWKRPSPE